VKNATTLMILATVLIGCGTSPTPTPTPIPPTQTPWVITATPVASTPVPALAYVPSGSDTITWNDAGNFVGQTKTVCGAVVRTTFAQNSNGQPTYLDLGRAYPDPKRFSVLIWGNQRGNFPSPPETLYRSQTICVTGKIVTYQGTLEMEVRTPSQIQVK
jgi:hypothetical protein